MVAIKERLRADTSRRLFVAVHALLGVQLELGPASLLPRRTLALAEGGPSPRRAITSDSGAASFSVPSTWVADRGSGVWSDPVLGDVADGMTIRETDTKLTAVTDLGKLAEIPLTSLGFDDLARADLVSGAQRTGNDGSLFYDYDLALSPAVCAREQEIVPGACLPTKVVLLSAAVLRGRLCTLRMDVSPAQWKRAAGQLRTVRTSFNGAAPS